MAQNFDDYEELLRAFESESVKRKSAAAAEPKKEPSKPSPEMAREIEKAGEERKKKVQNFSLNIDGKSEQKSSYRGEVYFSNPPKEIRSAADKALEKEKTAEIPAVTPPKEKKAAPPPPSATQKKVIAVKNQKKQRKQAKRTAGDGNANAKNNGKGGKIINALPKTAFVFAIIIFFSVILSVYGISCMNDIFAMNRDDTAVEVTVSDGMSDGEVIRILGRNGLIKNRLFCRLFVKVLHDNQYGYVSGIYTLTKDMGLEKMLSTVSAAYQSSETVTLTFPEGWTVDQIAQKLEANEVCTAASFISTVSTIDFTEEYPFLSSIDNKEERFRALEGYIYPDTYDFYVGETASSVVRRFLDNFQTKWIESYQKKADSLGMTVDEVITLASILQKEAATSKQMGSISSVLHNRLDSSNFQWLQCDSTETYLLETIKPTLTSSTSDTERYIRYRDLYDTYSTECKGLPLGAICNPGDSAIYAALNPEDTNYYYFRHDDNGKIYLASSFAEHEQNARKIESSK